MVLVARSCDKQGLFRLGTAILNIRPLLICRVSGRVGIYHIGLMCRRAVGSSLQNIEHSYKLIVNAYASTDDSGKIPSEALEIAGCGQSEDRSAEISAGRRKKIEGRRSGKPFPSLRVVSSNDQAGVGPYRAVEGHSQA